MDEKTLRRAKELQLEALKACQAADREGSTLVDTTFAELFVIAGLVQLALAHPDHDGPSRIIGQSFVNRISRQMGAYSPAISAAIALGDRSKFDFTIRDEENL
jgi:hypothetical protein